MVLFAVLKLLSLIRPHLFIFVFISVTIRDRSKSCYDLCQGFPCGSASKESACSMGDLGLIPGLGRSPEEGILA